jgi:hypothetical protein
MVEIYLINNRSNIKKPCKNTNKHKMDRHKVKKRKITSGISKKKQSKGRKVGGRIVYSKAENEYMNREAVKKVRKMKNGSKVRKHAKYAEGAGDMYRVNLVKNKKMRYFADHKYNKIHTKKNRSVNIRNEYTNIPGVSVYTRGGICNKPCGICTLCTGSKEGVYNSRVNINKQAVKCTLCTVIKARDSEESGHAVAIVVPYICKLVMYTVFSSAVITHIERCSKQNTNKWYSLLSKYEAMWGIIERMRKKFGKMIWANGKGNASPLISILLNGWSNNVVKGCTFYGMSFYKVENFAKGGRNNIRKWPGIAKYGIIKSVFTGISAYLLTKMSMPGDDGNIVDFPPLGQRKGKSTYVSLVSVFTPKYVMALVLRNGMHGYSRYGE